MLGFGDLRTSMQLSQRQRAARDREKEESCLYAGPSHPAVHETIWILPFFFSRCLTVLLRSQRLGVPVGSQSLFPAAWVCWQVCCWRAAGRCRKTSPETGRRRRKSGCSRWSCCGSLCWYLSFSSSSSWLVEPCPPSAGGNLPAYIC